MREKRKIIRSCLVSSLGGALYQADFYTYEVIGDNDVFLTLKHKETGAVWIAESLSYVWDEDNTLLRIYGFTFEYISECTDTNPPPPEEDIWL